MKTIGTAQLIHSPHGHELVHGTTGSGKTTQVRKLLADDLANGREVWVIDPLGTELPDWQDKAHRYANDITGAEEILVDLLHAIRYDAWSRRPLTVTIDTATEVLRSHVCRRLVEDALAEARGRAIRLRLVVNTLLLPSFGDSQAIRAKLVDGVTEVAS